MKRILTLAILASLCACSPAGTVRETNADILGSGAPTKEVPIPAGASVADIRAATPKPRPAAVSPYVTLGSDAANLDVDTATLVDLGTGCQYTVRTIFQSDMEIGPRNESAPAGPRQRCGRARPGSMEFALLPGGDTDSMHVSIVRDHETGCDEIVGSMYQEALFATQRMEAVGDGRRQYCRRPDGENR